MNYDGSIDSKVDAKSQAKHVHVNGSTTSMQQRTLTLLSQQHNHMNVTTTNNNNNNAHVNNVYLHDTTGIHAQHTTCCSNTHIYYFHI